MVTIDCVQVACIIYSSITKTAQLPGALFASTLGVDKYKQRYYVWRSCYLQYKHR